jgi:hypothetical protein
MSGQNQNSLHTSPVLSVLLLSSFGIKPKTCAIEMLIKIHQFLSYSYTTTIALTVKSTAITREIKFSSAVQTRDDFLHAGTVSEDEPKEVIQAQHKHC